MHQPSRFKPPVKAIACEWKSAMPSTSQKFSVGLFVIIGMSIIVFFILLIGLSDFFRDGNRYVGYFRDSIQGLNPSAKVTYRGVQVGLVESINIAPDGDLIEVVMVIDTRVASAEDLIASVRAIGITPIRYIDLDRADPEDIGKTPELSFEPKYPVIATRPSELSRMVNNAEEIITKLQQLQIKEISEGILTTLENFNRLTVEANVGEISSGLLQAIENSNTIIASLETTTGEFNQLIIDTRRAINRVDAILETSSEQIEKSMADAGKAAENASEFFNQASVMIADTGNRIESYDHKFDIIVDDLQQAAVNLNRLLEQLSNNPSQLVFGQPALPKATEN